MAKARSKPLLVSRRNWLCQRLLARLRDVDQTILNDAALKHLAHEAAQRLAGGGLGYGEFNIVLASVSRVIDSLAAIERGAARGPITAAELKRLQKDCKLPRLPPWF